MRCKHENAARLHGECTYDAHGFIVYEVEFRECFDCGAWLPLGPANDTPEVTVEIRCAEFLACYEDSKRLDECICYLPERRLPPKQEREAKEMYDTLFWDARCIAEHPTGADQ